MRTITLDRDTATALVHGDGYSVVTSTPKVDPPWLVGEHVLIVKQRFVIRRILGEHGLVVEPMGQLSQFRR